MNNQYYPGNQTNRSIESGRNNQDFNQLTSVSRPVVTHYIYPEQLSTPRTTTNINGQYSNNQRNKYWWESSGPFQPYRTTYQDYGDGKTLNYRTPDIHITQPYFYHELRGIYRPPESDPNRFDFDVPPSLNTSRY
ncbi:unnamed protein product [Rotaria sp. Silwood2]|nr:unnamed protein product [Rotaria sp. Silwood2]CAF2713205.1 unnamed protein product [Rotaria sp. Silwood2]CAF2972638.1 unnamed protein product [Rotaria sp. Silwood2]CAF3125004.1 unnamed protein product [Rotaria sp. Silwood2]CAF4219044.1 unnamed protein product [Rotaria sp. Silwood2]